MSARRWDRSLLSRLLVQHVLLFLVLAVSIVLPLLLHLNSVLISRQLDLSQYEIQKLVDYVDGQISAGQQLIESIYVSGGMSRIVFEQLKQYSDPDPIVELDNERLFLGFLRHAVRADAGMASLGLQYLNAGEWTLIEPGVDGGTPSVSAASVYELPDVVHTRRYFELIPTRIIVDEYDRQRAIYTIVTTIHDFNLNVIGGLAINFDTAAIDAVADELAGGPDGYIQIDDRRGRTLYRSTGAYSLDGDAEGRDTRSSRIVTTARSRDHGLEIVKSISTRTLHGFTRGSLLALLLMVVLVVVATVVLFYLADKGLARRVTRLLTAMEAVQGGSLDYRIVSTGPEDEISRVYEEFNQMCDELQRRIRNEYELQLRLKESQLNLLQSQINPHFLYNTLEAFRVMAQRSGDGNLADMIQALARVSRDNIRRGQLYHSVIAEERYVRDLLSLYQMRYGQRLRHDVTMDPTAASFLIPRLLSQPIVENAVKYSIDACTRITEVRVSFGCTEDGTLCIEVSDNGPGIPAAAVKSLELQSASGAPDPHGRSLGLSNVAKRLRATYGDRATLRIAASDGGTVVRLRVPAVTEGNCDGPM